MVVEFRNRPMESSTPGSIWKQLLGCLIQQVYPAAYPLTDDTFLAAVERVLEGPLVPPILGPALERLSQAHGVYPQTPVATSQP